jgi:hypothetical protein
VTRRSVTGPPPDLLFRAKEEYVAGGRTLPSCLPGGTREEALAARRLLVRNDLIATRLTSAKRYGRRALGFPVFRYASPDLDAHEFEELLRARGMEGSAPCPICEGLDWISPPRSYALVEDGDVEHGLTVLPFLCTNCGFVRLHAPKAIDAPKLAGLED